jgi:hypothetical protein
MEHGSSELRPKLGKGNVPGATRQCNMHIAGVGRTHRSTFGTVKHGVKRGAG